MLYSIYKRVLKSSWCDLLHKIWTKWQTLECGDEGLLGWDKNHLPLPLYIFGNTFMLLLYKYMHISMHINILTDILIYTEFIDIPNSMFDIWILWVILSLICNQNIIWEFYVIVKISLDVFNHRVLNDLYIVCMHYFFLSIVATRDILFQPWFPFSWLEVSSDITILNTHNHLRITDIMHKTADYK